ncbi:uncharacterized protein LOC124539186 [Vanessa cardui]|uniref:uncharacterized protein LOC124539186 n=1 Tax=Vanessa cardui TaxID=171605 RepID=UPI001F12C1D3|nr:uncharacterized protein LOC124539186 [Vanessa cardui]
MVRTYTPKNATRQVVDEESMQSAIQDVVQGVLSYRKAANKYNLKLSTLESRVKTYRKRNDAEGSSNRTFNSKYTSFQVFSSEEEKLLNDYIIKCCKMHYGLTTIQTRKLAYEYAKSLSLKYPAKWEDDKMAGKEWMYGFRRRNPEISLRKPENTSAARSFAFNKTSVSEFYTNLKTVLERHPLTADRIFNFDESGVSTVLATPKVLAPKCQKQVGQIVSAERGELVTFGGIISASGNTIPPLFVFPRVHYRDNFLEGAPEGSLGAANRSGWINSFIFVSVLKHIQKHTLCTKDNPILLLCDNHESHVSLEAINYAKENGIIYLSFPPHTSHRLQPLDVGVFAAFKSKLKIAFNNWHTMNPGKALTIYNIPKLVKIAYFESFTAKNIISGFNKPGIWPLNELAFGDEDFAPTEVYASRNIENVTSTQNIVEDLSAPTPQPVVSDICHPSTSGTQDFLEIPPESTEQTINSPLITDDDELQRNNLDASEPDALNISPTRQIVAPLKTVLTPEAIRPYPTVVRSNKTNKGRRPGKSRIYTDTPEKKAIEDKHNEKEMKKLEQERRARAREMKRSLVGFNLKTKNKKVKNTKSQESDSDGSDISFQESSTSVIDEDENEHENFEINNSQLTVDVIPENIKDGSFVLVKFPKKKSIIYYVGKVVSHYSKTEFKISYLRKKPGYSWTFVFPNVEDIHTVYITDVEMILPEPKPPKFCTSRTSKLFTFSVNFSNYIVQ